MEHSTILGNHDAVYNRQCTLYTHDTTVLCVHMADDSVMNVNYDFVLYFKIRFGSSPGSTFNPPCEFSYAAAGSMLNVS